MKKTILLALLFASPVLAQDQPPTVSAGGGCGPSEAKFDVKTNDKQHPVAPPEAGKVYYLRTQVYERSEQDRNVKMEPVEIAEGQFLISASSFSTSHPKK